MRRTTLVLGSILGTFVMFNACQKVKPSMMSELDDPRIRGIMSSILTGGQRSQQAEDTYDAMLTTCVYGLLELSQLSTFVDEVNTQVALQFDGDDNVLLTTLSNELDGPFFSMIDSMQASINAWGPIGVLSGSSHLNAAIHGFQYDDDTGFVQIFIPFFESVNLEEAPIVAASYEPDDDTIVGYRIENGQLVTYDVITEGVASSRLIWVISVNETRGDVSQVGGIGASGDRGPGDNIAIQVTHVYIEDKKEKFPNGRADIKLLTIQWDGPNCDYSNTDTWRVWVDEDGYPFKVKTADLYEWLEVPYFWVAGMNPTNTPISYWQPWERLGIGFWEHDKRKKFEKTVQWDPHCPTGLNPLNTYYRSKEDKYGMIELNYAYFEQNATTSWQQEDIESPLLEGGRLRIQYRIAN